MEISEQLNVIEKNHFEHFVFLPKKIGCNVTALNGVSLINCGLQSSMFNIVYGAPNETSAITKIKEAFNGQPFAWWVPPSLHTPELTKALIENDLIIEANEHAMICDLTEVTSTEYKANLLIRPVTNKGLLEEFISILEPYDPAARKFYDKVNEKYLLLEEKLFVGFENEKSVAIGILFLTDNTAGIFSLLTRDDARGKGFGTDMMRFMLAFAKENGAKSVTLSASSNSGYRIYEHLGFRNIGEFKCFESK